jgi:hypothetical protein
LRAALDTPPDEDRLRARAEDFSLATITRAYLRVLGIGGER